MKEKAYEKKNRIMRSDHKSENGKTIGKRLTSGTSPRRVSFACRFSKMEGGMTDGKGGPSNLARALTKWGFGSKAAAASFCSKNKKSKK